MWPMGLFRRAPKPPPPYSPSTGNEGDDQLLGFFAVADGGLTTPREWNHYVYCDDAADAAAMETAARAEGWTVDRVAQGEGIVATRSDLPVNAETVPRARAFFEGLASGATGGDYDGWDAAA